MNKRLSVLFIIFVISISIPVILPFFHNGYFPTHDGEWAVVRLADMFRTLKDFQFPARYSGALNFGYGYPLFNFAYPFPYYFGVFLYIPLQSFIGSIKTIFVLSTILSSLFMYFASRELWKSRAAGVISSAIYLYLPYRMIDLYVRGSIGETISFALFPLILFLTLRLFKNPFSRPIAIILPISIAMLVLSHNIMTILFMPWFAAYILIRIFSEKRFDVLQTFILSVVLGAGLSAFFWFPALYEKGEIALSQVPIADRSLYFVEFKDLLVPTWGYAPPTESGGFSYQLGVAQIIILVLSFLFLAITFLKEKITKSLELKNAVLLVGIYFVLLIMMFSFTDIIWKNTPLLREINYPWTLLSQIGFIGALLAGFVAIKGRFGLWLAIIASVIAIIVTFPYVKPSEYVDRGEGFYLTNEATTTSSDEYMPLWVKEKPLEHFMDKVEVISGSAQISNLSYNSKRIEFNYSSSSSDPVFRINTIYYPGWEAYLNHDPVDIAYDNPKGVMEIKASQNRDRVLLVFEETFSRFMANIISVLSLLVIGFITLRRVLSF